MAWPDRPADLTPGRHRLSPEEVRRSQRDRLMHAVAELAAEVGCSSITAGELTRRAGVSRATLYELYDSKDACVLAASREALDQLMSLIEAATRTDRPATVRLHGTVELLIRFCAAHPLAARLSLVEIGGAGPEGAAQRSHGLARMREALEPLVREVAPKAPPMATDLLVGGLYEVVSKRLRSGRTKQLPELLPELRELIDSLLGAAGR